MSIDDIEARIKMLRRNGVTRATIPAGGDGYIEVELGPEPAAAIVDTSAMVALMSEDSAKKKFEQRDDGLTDEQAKMLYVGF